MSNFNLANYVLTAGRMTPEKTALAVVGGDPWSVNFAQLERAVLGVATGLVARNPTSGARVLLRLSNSPLFPICYLGAIAAGLIPVPTSAQLTHTEVDKIAEALTPEIVLADADLPVPTSSNPIRGDAISAMMTLPPAPYDLGDANRPAYIVYTSGTSGKATPVVHAHRAILARKSMWDGWYGLRSDDRMMHAGAFNWTYTLGTGLMDPWSIGATALIPAADVAPKDLPKLIAQHQASIFAAAPGVYRRLLRGTVPDLPTLRHGLSAGEKLPETTRTAWTNATNTPIFEAYGMSECSTFISGSPSRPAPNGTLGYPQRGRKIALRDTKIAVHKDDLGLMLGYYNQPVETAAKFDGDWFLTGDIGSQIADGAIRYEGRADDMMNAGGTRVSPIEVENALALHPDIGEVACAEVQVKSDLTLIAAFYLAKHVIDQDQLATFAATHLATYKVPRLFVRVPTLPRGTNNKLLRRQLRREWEAEHGQT